VVLLKKDHQAIGQFLLTPVAQQSPIYQINTPGGDTQGIFNFEYRIPIFGPVTMAPFFDAGLNKILFPSQLRVNQGRDHNVRGFTTLLAGGGFKGGITYGATDEFGLTAVEKPVHPHDLHATVLHLLGLDHTRLTYRYSGRDFRLTDVNGRVVKELLA